MELTRLFDLIPYQIQKFNKEIAFSRKEEGVWKTYSSKEVQDIIEKLLSFQKIVLNGILLIWRVSR
jgi:long-chain acyl-CoA synthetase